MVGGGCLQQGNGKQKKLGSVCQGQCQESSCQIFFGNHFGMVVEFMVDQKGGTARCTHEKNTRHSRARVKRGGWKLQNIYLGVRSTILN